MGNTALKSFKNSPGMAKSYFPFGWMNIHVYLAGWASEIENRQGVTSLHESGFVSPANCLQKRTCSNGPTVDENMDVIAFSTGNVGRTDPS
jgi:hypothetical protein